MSAPQIMPLGENVLIQPLKQEQQTASGIYLPDTASTEKPQEGTVKAVGSSDTIAVKKDQTVIFNKYSGTEVTADGEEYLIVKAEDILAVVE